MSSTNSTFPTVKVTGGQRIDLLGVKKEDLPAVWADLDAAGMVSGHAYAKGLRTVKTCVGSDWCRFGTQDSTGLGIRSRNCMWGSWTPAKVKLAVSGCPRNCAEVDLQGYRRHLRRIPATKSISPAPPASTSRAPTFSAMSGREDEALEAIAAFVQMYREQAAYLDRIYKWAKRVGVASTPRKSRRCRTSARRYFDRFVFSQHSRRSIPGRSASPARTCTSSCRWPCSTSLSAAE